MPLKKGSNVENNTEVLKPYRVPYLHSSLFANVMADAFLQLEILGECVNFLSNIKANYDLPVISAQKFGVQMPKESDDDLNLVKEKSNDHCQLNKMLADRQVTMCFMECLSKELLLAESFESFVKHVSSMENTYIFTKLEFLASQYDSLRCTKRDLGRQLRWQRNRHKNDIYEMDVDIVKLRNQEDDNTIYAETRRRYIGKYQNGRMEQLAQKIDEKEMSSCYKTENFKNQSELELRAHSEIEMLNNIDIQEVQATTFEWMNKYEKDIETIDIKIHLKKNDYEIQIDKNVQLEETIEKHTKELEAWKEFCAEREKLQQYREKMTRSAITVQAWWRGLMLRQQLGPYKPKTKKPGNKKKKTQKPSGKA